MLIGCLLAVVFLVLAVLSRAGPPGFAGNFGLLLVVGGVVAGPFVVCGGLLSGFWLLRRVSDSPLGPPSVTISNQKPRVGEAVTVHYQQLFRRATEVRAIRLRLVFREIFIRHDSSREQVRSQYGYQDHIVQEYQLPARSFEAGQSVQADRQFQVGGMHSLYGYGSRLEWLVVVQVDMADWPAFMQSIRLDVPAELAP
jgi:hypothetical protein